MSNSAKDCFVVSFLVSCSEGARDGSLQDASDGHSEAQIADSVCVKIAGLLQASQEQPLLQVSLIEIRKKKNRKKRRRC